MKKEAAIIGFIVCIAAGLGVGWLIGATVSAPQTVDLVDQIKSRGYLNVGTSADYPPFEDYNTTTGEYYGFDIDIAKLIADELGVELQIQDMDFDSLIGACSAGTIDMIAAAMTDTAERREQLLPSVTYVTVTQVVIVKESSTLEIEELSDLQGKAVGCQTGTVMQNELEDAGVTPTTYARADLLIQALVAGDIDAAYVDGPIYTAYADTEDIKVIYSTPSEDLALWCRKSTPDLMYVINGVIFDGYQEGTIQELLLKWF
ncbi:MAG: Glutamine-binding periplasmic protein [Promethearchaeota archaeon]|nr:MAG: Glutamine-binding periplasmic protein [Candidatus Lokiarchaeota archaeon]